MKMSKIILIFFHTPTPIGKWDQKANLDFRHVFLEFTENDSPIVLEVLAFKSSMSMFIYLVLAACFHLTKEGNSSIIILDKIQFGN